MRCPSSTTSRSSRSGLFLAGAPVCAVDMVAGDASSGQRRLSHEEKSMVQRSKAALFPTAHNRRPPRRHDIMSSPAHQDSEAGEAKDAAEGAPLHLMTKVLRPLLNGPLPPFVRGHSPQVLADTMHVPLWAELCPSFCLLSTRNAWRRRPTSASAVRWPLRGSSRPLAGPIMLTKRMTRPAPGTTPVREYEPDNTMLQAYEPVLARMQEMRASWDAGPCYPTPCRRRVRV